MAKDDKTADLFEADGVTPKAAEKPVITAEQLAAETRAAAAEGEAKGLKAALNAKPAAQPKTEKTFTRQELRAKVNAGEITEDQMDDTLAAQLRASITTEVKATVTAENTAQEITNSIKRYVGVFPNINVDGSELRAKIEAKFQTLVKRGQPDSLATELTAIEAVCGELSTGGGRRREPDAHEEIGSGAGGDGGKPDTDGPFKGLSPALTKHYKKMIDKGMYKGPNDPRLQQELKHARRPN